MVDATGFETEATWNTVSGSILSGFATSRTPNPFEYTTLSWYTTATATPGTPVWSMARCTMLSSWPTAVSTFVWSHSGGTGRTGVGISSPGGAGLEDGADERGGVGGRPPRGGAPPPRPPAPPRRPPPARAPPLRPVPLGPSHERPPR